MSAGATLGPEDSQHPAGELWCRGQGCDLQGGCSWNLKLPAHASTFLIRACRYVCKKQHTVLYEAFVLPYTSVFGTILLFSGIVCKGSPLQVKPRHHIWEAVGASSKY
eukprot:scaffold219824_cov33-Tisochrysis_lutea.AAC.1